MSDEHQHAHASTPPVPEPVEGAGGEHDHSMHDHASTSPVPEPIEGAGGGHDHSMHDHASTPAVPEPVEGAGGEHDHSMHDHTSPPPAAHGASTSSAHGGEHDHSMHKHTSAPSAAHEGAHADHTGHENLFRRKFWVSLILSVPVILYSMGLQLMTGLTMPAFPGSRRIGFGRHPALAGGRCYTDVVQHGDRGDQRSIAAPYCALIRACWEAV